MHIEVTRKRGRPKVPGTEKSRNYTFRLPDSLRERLHEVATDMECSVATVIIKACLATLRAPKGK